MIKSYSWNVNGLRACAEKGFLDWVETTAADFICIQEIKLQEPQLTDELRHPMAYNGKRYHSFWAFSERKGYSGTGLYVLREPVSVTKLGIPEFDIEGRTVIADYGGFLIMSAYFPNSQEAGMRLDYKLRFCDAILDFCNFERSKGKHVIVAGDYNIAHKPIDLARPEQNEGNAGYLPEERAWMDKFTSIGYIDTFRLFCKEPGRYTWWSYRSPKAREKNIGWRLDYHCVDKEFSPALLAADIHAEVMGSDHCPVSLFLDL
jgi:exodeoxyribonuclease-3